MPGEIPSSSTDKQFADSSSLLGAVGRAFMIVGLAGPLLFSLWSVAGYVRDVGFNQLTLYPVRCQDVACQALLALPRIRFEVHAKPAEVILWQERGWGGHAKDTDIYRLKGCMVADRTTWTCRSQVNGGVFAFHDGNPLRLDALPMGSGLTNSLQPPRSTLRFVSRLQWYRTALNSWLTGFPQ
jgi:hypothetical protein